MDAAGLAPSLPERRSNHANALALVAVLVWPPRSTPVAGEPEEANRLYRAKEWAGAARAYESL